MPFPARYRDSARAIAIADGHLLVIRRVHPRYGEYFVFPGGGIEEGEDPAGTVVREILEETGLRVSVGREVMFGSTPQEKIQRFYLVTAPMRPVALPKHAEESGKERQQERGSYEPQWIPLGRINTLKLQPPIVKSKLLEFLSSQFPEETVDLGPLFHEPRTS